MLSLTVVLLVVSGIALAAGTLPKDGRFRAYGTVGGANPTPEYFTVSRSGRSLTFELNLSIDCKTNYGTLRTGVSPTSDNLGATGKSVPLTIANGSFSYSGPIYNVLGVTGNGRISGTFRSPTKIAGTARFSWPTSTLAPGTEGPCETGKLAFSGERE